MAQNIFKDIDALIQMCDDELQHNDTTNTGRYECKSTGPDGEFDSTGDTSDSETSIDSFNIDMGGCDHETFIDFDFSKIESFVIDKVSQYEKEYNIHVLCCVERSSHVWGTSHKLSDFDIKAIFYYNKQNYYSPLQQTMKQFKIVYGPRSKIKENQCEMDIELTFVELKHCCHLIMNNDPNIIEIFKSPIVYYFEQRLLNQNITTSRIDSILSNVYDQQRLIMHYYSWAKGHYHQLSDCTTQRAKEKPLKFLFHIWRGILTADWLIEHKTLKNMPLYIPTLIENATIIDENTKKLMIDVLVNDIRNSQFELTPKSIKLKNLVPTILKHYKETLPSKNEYKNMKKAMKNNGYQNALLEFEKIIFKIIERSDE